MKKNKTNLLFLFFLTSFLGWVMETLGSFLVYKEWVDRGFMYLPFCPIYGIAVTLIFILLKIPSYGYLPNLYKKYENSKVKKFSLYFSYAFVFGMICGIVEYFTGYIIDTFEGEELWSYQGEIDSINGYVRLSYIFLFGLFGMLYMRYIYKNIYLFLEKQKKKYIQIINIVLSILFLIDILYQVIKI